MHQHTPFVMSASETFDNLVGDPHWGKSILWVLSPDAGCFANPRDIIMVVLVGLLVQFELCERGTKLQLGGLPVDKACSAEGILGRDVGRMVDWMPPWDLRKRSGRAASGRPRPPILRCPRPRVRDHLPLMRECLWAEGAW